MLRESIFPVQRSVRFQPLERRLLFSATPAGAVDAPDDAAVSEDANAADNVDVGISSDQASVADLEAQAAGAESLDSELTAVSAGGEGSAVPASAPANVAAAATAESQVAQAPAETALDATQTPGDTSAAPGEASALASPPDVSLLAVVTDALAEPTVTVNAPAFAMISEPFSYSITFDNTGTEPGYGPFIDERLAPGLDSLGPPTLFGSPVAVVATVDNSDGIDAVPFVHPYTGETIMIDPGEEFRVFELPFGSVVPDQPTFDLQLSAKTDKDEGALVGDSDSLKIEARGGFRFGLDPTDNPDADPPIVSPPPPATEFVTPTVLEVSKVVIAPESETATGPNFPVTYQITIDVADGEMITDLQITDEIANNLEYLGLVNDGGATDISQPPIEPPPDPPFTVPPTNGRILGLTFDSVTGTESDSDIVIEYRVFVAEFDADGVPVIPPDTGQAAESVNRVDAGATYDPDGPEPDSLDPVEIHDTFEEPALLPNTATLHDKSLATQKGVALVNDAGALGVGPLDTLQYTINVQVSDFFEFNNLIVTDLISDGQHFDDSFTPTISFREEDITTSGNFTLGPPPPPEPGGNFTFLRDLSSGDTTANFDVSSAMVALGADRLLTGDLAKDSTRTSGTILTITYQTVVDEAFIDVPPGNNPSVGAGDSVGNDVDASGQVVRDDETLSEPVFDDSSSSVTIAPIEIEKSVHAVNNNTAATGSFGPGDRVTFQFEATGNRPTGKVDDVTITDFLPLPKFVAAEVRTLRLEFVPDTAAFQPTSFIAGEVVMVFDSDFYEGPDPVSDDPLKQNLNPVLIVDSRANSFTIDLGDLDAIEGQGSRIVTFVTVTATDAPAADGLQLTNELVVEASNSQGETVQFVDTVQITVKEPVLDIYKGVVGYEAIGLTLGGVGGVGGVAFSAPNVPSSFTGAVNSTAKAQAIDASNLRANEVDGQDEVRFAIVLENTGRSDAFNVNFEDQIPLGYVFPTDAGAMELTVRLGDGTLLVQSTPMVVNDYTVTFVSATRTFSIELIDDVGQGALNQGKLGDGTELPPQFDGLNYVVITYDLDLASDVDSDATLTNTATLTKYTGLESSTQNRVPEGLTADAFVRTATPVIGKQLVGTEIVETNNSNTQDGDIPPQAVIGEKITYTVLVTVPEGTTDSATIVDSLDPGLEFVEITSVVTAGIDATVAETVSADGRVITFNLGNPVNPDGNLVNPDGNNAEVETIAITYEVRVRNVLGNQQDTQLNNSAVFSWQTADQSTDPLASTPHGASFEVQAENVTVVEPQIITSKSVSPTSGADAGDAVTYTITYEADASRPTAYDTVFTDSLPSELVSYVITDVTDSAGLLGIGSFQITAGNVLQLSPLTLLETVDMAPGRIVTVTVQGNVISTINPNQTVTNTARAAWTSLDGPLPLIERTGAAPPLNDYVSEDPALFNARNLAIAKAIVSTSEASTVANNLLTIGEIVRYSVTLTVPEGQTPNLQIQDLLPPGLTFLNDGTATYRTNNVPPGRLTSLDFGTFEGLGELTNTPTLFPDSHVGSSSLTTADPDVFSTGTDVFFKFATLANADRVNSTPEQIIVEFNAIADNSVTQINGVPQSNDAGEVVANRARATSNNNSNPPTTDPVNSTIVEPNLSVAKTLVGPPTVEAGGPVSFVIVINALSGADRTTAFDIVVEDLVPAEIEIVTVTVTGTPGTVVDPPGFIMNGNAVTITAASMAPGSTLTVTIAGTAVEDILLGSTFTNTADLTYTSLPGPTGTTSNPTGSVVPEGSGSALGERDGSDGIGGIPNDYAATDSADFQTGLLTISKTFKDGTLDDSDTSETGPGDSTGANVQIGEQVFYDIIVRTPDGAVNDLVVTDVLPAGMRLDSWQLLTNAGAASFILEDFKDLDETPLTDPVVTPGPPVNGLASVTFTFSDFVADVGEDGNPDITDNVFAIRLTTTVLNVSGNQNGTAITNTAFATFVNNAGATVPVTQIPANTTVQVVEPVLEITKDTTATNIEAGDTVTYVITVQHAGTSTASAYDLQIADTLPDALSFGDVVSATIDGTDVMPSFSFSGDDLVVEDNAIDLLLGQTLTLTISGQAIISVGPGDTITNTATVTYTSINDTGALSTEGERNGAGLNDPSDTVNDYFASATSVITVPGLLTVDKSIIDPPDARVTIGQELTYHVEVSLIEGTTEDVTLVDALPAGTEFVLDSVVVIAPGVGLQGQVVDFPAPDTLRISWTSVTIPEEIDSGAGTDVDTGSFVVEYKVRVLNIAANQSGTQLPNTVTATAEAGLSDSDPAQAVIIEPVLEITKTTPATNIEAEDTVTYTIIVQHTDASTANAYDLEIIDTLPVQLQNASVVSAFIDSTDVMLSFSFSGDDLVVEDNAIDLLLGQTLMLTISGQAVSSVGPGDAITNTATVTYTSINDTGALSTEGERNGAGLNDPSDTVNDYFDSATVDITVPGFLEIDKSIVDPVDDDIDDGVPVGVSIGEVLTYQVSVSIIEGTTEDIQLVDALPDGTVYLDGSFVVADAGGVTLANQLVTYDPGSNTLTISYDSAAAPGVIDSGSGTDVDTGTFIVQYQVRVLDVPENTSGPPATPLPNTVTATAEPDFNGGIGLTDVDNELARVIEPDLTVSKSVDDQIVSAGQLLTYTLTVEHTAESTATAYDFVLTDIVPAELQNVAVTSVTGSGGVTGLTNLSLGNFLRIRADSVPLGGTITIVFTANVSLATSGGSAIDNNVRIFWDSLGGGDGNDILDGTPDPDEVDRDYGAQVGVVEDPDAAIDPAQDTERVVVGSLSIGDTVWLDQNRNGVVDAGEAGIPNVLIFIDLNRDGTRNPNEPFDLTDANGIYGISSLAPGLYSVRVDPATLPPGLLEVFVFDDPRVPGAPLLGGFSTEVLLDFTNEERADFGYFLPPIPPVPPVTPSPLLPPPGRGGEPSAEPEVEPEAFSALDTFFIDVFNSVLGGPSVIEEPLLPFALVGEPSPLPSAAAGFPLLSGAAEPGSNITLTFYSATGELIFSNTILVPSGGNWVASFPDVDTTGNVSVVAQVAANNLTPLSTDNNFNFRANYATPMDSFFVSRALTVDRVFSELASRRMGVMAPIDEPIIPGDWTKRNYEFLAAPAVPSF